MKLKTISDKYNTYLKKVKREKSESVSIYYFYGDKETEGVNQCIFYTKHLYDREYGENEIIDKCNELIKYGWKNIVVKRYKNYYERLKTCPVNNLKSMCVNKYKFV